MNRVTRYYRTDRGPARPRILILSASAGGGHVRAAEAVQLALAEVCPDAVVANVDVLDFTTAAVRTFYTDGYYNVVRRAPHLVGYLYDRLDHPPGTRVGRAGGAARLQNRLRGYVQRFNFGRLVTLLAGGRWDLAINTHFLPADLIASLRRRGRVSFPQVTVTTDFYAHRLWVHSPCERYFVACDEARASLSARVPPHAVFATGIPIHPAFAEPKGPSACRRRHRICEDRPVVLQLAGGLGLGPVEQTHRSILRVDRPVHVVTVCGHNDDLRRRLGQVPCPPRHRHTVLGYTHEMDELMAAADVIVSKPGGLTTSEALARGAAMVIIDPIPGQEGRNADYLLENGAAIKVNHPPTLGYKLQALLSEPGRLARLRRRAAALGRPRAAFEVARLSLEVLGIAAADATSDSPDPTAEPLAMAAV